MNGSPVFLELEQLDNSQRYFYRTDYGQWSSVFGFIFNALISAFLITLLFETILRALVMIKNCKKSKFKLTKGKNYE